MSLLLSVLVRGLTYLGPSYDHRRVVHGAGLLYLLALVFILVQSENNARQFLTFFYPDLGKPPAANDLIYASGKLLPNPSTEARPYSRKCLF